MKKLVVILVSLIGLQAVAQDNPKFLNVMAVNGLNMRSQPDEHARVVTKVPYGKQVELLERTEIELQLGWITDHWYKVRFRGREGFIFGGYLASLPTPTVETIVSLSDILPTYCFRNLKQEGSTIHATERTRNGDTLHYSLLKYSGGMELELESHSDRKNTKLLLPASVQETYVLLEALLKSSGNAQLLDELRFVKGQDGKLLRLSTASGSISVKAVSERVVALEIIDHGVEVSAR